METSDSPFFLGRKEQVNENENKANSHRHSKNSVKHTDVVAVGERQGFWCICARIKLCLSNINLKCFLFLSHNIYVLLFHSLTLSYITIEGHYFQYKVTHLFIFTHFQSWMHNKALYCCFWLLFGGIKPFFGYFSKLFPSLWKINNILLSLKFFKWRHY